MSALPPVAEDASLVIGNYAVAFIDLLGQRAALRGQMLLPVAKTDPEKQQLLATLKASVGSISALQQHAETMTRTSEPNPESPLRAKLTSQQQEQWDEMQRTKIVTQRWSDGLMLFCNLGDPRRNLPRHACTGCRRSLAHSLSRRVFRKRCIASQPSRSLRQGIRIRPGANQHASSEPEHQVGIQVCSSASVLRGTQAPGAKEWRLTLPSKGLPRQAGPGLSCRTVRPQIQRSMASERRKLLSQRPELVERYIRRWMYRKAISLGRRFARRVSRPRLQWSERKRRKALLSALHVTAVEAAKARRLGFRATETVLNLGLFFLIAERDIQAVKVDALTHPDQWRRSLSARVMLLTIHELDLDKVAGNTLRQVLEATDVPQDLRVQVAEAMRSIRKSQERARRRFAYLRNSTIAHRDPDAIRQYRDITEIEGLDVVQIAAEFYEGTHKFMEVLPALLGYLGTMPALIKQLVRKVEASK